MFHLPSMGGSERDHNSKNLYVHNSNKLNAVLFISDVEGSTLLTNWWWGGGSWLNSWRIENQSLRSKLHRNTNCAVIISIVVATCFFYIHFLKSLNTL